MDTLRSEDFSIKHIGHLGLIADKIDSLNLIDLIDSRLPVSTHHGAKVTHGERVAAMILNGLGFIDSRLYLFPDFLKDKPIEKLFNRELKAEWFNDDALGRCLDAIAEYGVTKFFTELSFQIGHSRGLLGRSANLDTTTLTLYGAYEDNTEALSEENQIPQPMQGYAKSGRHDLKQMVLLLATTGASRFPIWMEAHSGNACDKKTLPTAAVKMNALCKGMEKAPEFIYVGDSAIYSNILEHSTNLYWITRVPETIKEARELVSLPKNLETFIPLEKGYSFYPTVSNYGGIQQRWLLFYSEAAYQREVKTLDKKIKKAFDEQDKDWWHLSNQVFTCQSDALTALKAQEKNLKYHKVEAQVIQINKHKRRGRPKNTDTPEVVGYQIQYALTLNESQVEILKSQKGRFILATNQLDETLLSNVEVLKEYKAQSGTELGFKFIKSDSFQVDGVFLKTPARIEALMMIMTLCLMVYGVTEYELHQSLKNKNETISNQSKKPTSTPSLRWIYFIFRGVNELNINMNGDIKKLIVNMTGVLRQIVHHFGKRAMTIYLNTG